MCFSKLQQKKNYNCNFIPAEIQSDITNGENKQYHLIENNTSEFYAILTFTNSSDSTCSKKERYLKRSYLKSDKDKCVNSVENKEMSYKHTLKYTKQGKKYFIRDVWNSTNCQNEPTHHMEVQCGTCSHSESEFNGDVYVNCQ